MSTVRYYAKRVLIVSLKFIFGVTLFAFMLCFIVVTIPLTLPGMAYKLWQESE